MNETLRIGLLGIGVPIALGVASTLLASPVQSHAGPNTHSRSSIARLFAGMVLAAFGLIVGATGVSGRLIPSVASSEQRLVVVMIAIGVIGVVGVLAGRAWIVGAPRRSAAFAGALAMVGFAVLLWNGLWATTSGPLGSFASRVGGVGILTPAIGAVLVALWASAGQFVVARMSFEKREVVAAMLLGGMAVATGATLLGTGSVTFGQSGFAVSGLAAGILLCALALKRRAVVATLSVPVFAALSAVMAAGVIYSDTPLWVWGTLGAAPVAGLMADTLLARKARPVVRSITAVLVAATVAAVAVAPGIGELLKFLQGDGNDSYEQYR